MNDICYGIEIIDCEETLVRYVYTSEYGYGICKRKPIISKTAFIECYNKWIGECQEKELENPKKNLND